MRHVLVFVFLFLAFVVACSSGLDRPVFSADAKLDDDGVQRVKIDMHSYYFEPKPGEYRFFCHKGSHEKKGMVGTLVVLE
ncbi:MAG: hypothetical protein L0Z51_01635 [Candidatus Latescibacteria bacterium]|nr:hypothetical protein [Candidatus Latescibacterota bacterium]